MRYILESIRPEIQQYFIERNWDGRPFSRDEHSVIYARAKQQDSEQSFGTEHDVMEAGNEFLVHSTVPLVLSNEEPRVRLGSKDRSKPYSMALLNVSAMSFGSLQNPWRYRALDVEDKAQRVMNYQKATVKSAVALMVAMGASHPDELASHMLRDNFDNELSLSYDDLYTRLKPGELLDQPPQDWEKTWNMAQPGTLAPNMR